MRLLLPWGRLYIRSREPAGGRSFAETSIFTHEQTVSLTVSVGLAQIPAKATLPQAIKLADDALYAAKAAGRNCLSVAA
ncbi:diguanylate cyclase domain-containing protein [Novosphingobium sp. UBA1939]